MRLYLRALAVLLVPLGAGCAHVEAPTGGDQMRDTLTVVAVTPDSLAVVPGLRGPVVFEFVRRLSERGLDDAVMVSPRTSAVAVGHRGRLLRVSLREGWEPDRIYHVTVLPGVLDLWGNRLDQTVAHVFSTGPQIPETRVEGLARDRITGRPEVNIRVEAIRAADSLVYATRTDSAGAFAFSFIPEGEYRVRAYRDVNRNRELDEFEARDTAIAPAAVGDTAQLALRVVMPDTTPPVMASAQWARDVVEVTFDDYLDPDQTLTPDQVQLTDAAGNPVAVRRIAVGRLEVEPDTVENAEVVATPEPAPQAQPGARPGAATDPRERLPSQTLTVEPAAPLAPETEYVVRVQGVRNVVGLTGGGEASFTTPATPAAPDEPQPDAQPEPPTEPPPSPPAEPPTEP